MLTFQINHDKDYVVVGGDSESNPVKVLSRVCEAIAVGAQQGIEDVGLQYHTVKQRTISEPTQEDIPSACYCCNYCFADVDFGG